MWTTTARASSSQDEFHHRTILAIDPKPMIVQKQEAHIQQVPSPARRMWQNLRGRLTTMTRRFKDIDHATQNLQSTSTESCGNSIISSSYVSAFSSPAAREAFAKYEKEMKARSTGSDDLDRIQSEGVAVGRATSYGNSSTDSSDFDNSCDDKVALEREEEKESYTLYLPENLHLKNNDRNCTGSRDDGDETTCSGAEAAASEDHDNDNDDAESEYVSCGDTISTLSGPSRAARMHSNRKLQLLAMLDELEVDVGPVRIPSSIQVGKKKDKHVIKKDRHEI